MIVLGEAHLRRILKSYARYCNGDQNASVFEQGCARLSLGTPHRCHLFTRDPSDFITIKVGFKFSLHTRGHLPCYSSWGEAVMRLK